ncbi:hypothetical protein ABPG75_004067 [Micractinium tetrahymenae]
MGRCRLWRTSCLLALLIIQASASSTEEASEHAAQLPGGTELEPSLNVHAFYYLWYGNPEHNVRWQHWDHEVLPHWTPSVSAQHPQIGTRFKPPAELHSPFYPLAGPYSSSDPQLLRRHFRELRAAGVGVAAVSWWGPQWRQNTTDTQGVSTDALLPALLEAAEAEGMAVSLHLEPYPGRTAASVREDLFYLMGRVGGSPALLRAEKRGPRLRRGLPVLFVYDSYHIPPGDWAQLLQPGGELSLRGTEADGIFIGLWLNYNDGDAQLLPGGFDGFYTYFSSEAVSYGANPSNWPELSRWAREHDKLFIPSVGAGYDDSKIRPWNAAATRDREGGARYRRWWHAALEAAPAAISITSFNEWGEGTQIEAARVFPAHSSTGDAPVYQSYGSVPGRDEHRYLNITAEYVQRWQQQERHPQDELPGKGGPHSEL